MKKRRILFKDKPLVIPIKGIKSDSIFRFWTNKPKTVEATIIRSVKSRYKGKKLRHIISKSEKTKILRYKLKDANYKYCENGKDKINIIFKEKESFLEKIIRNILYFQENKKIVPATIRKILNFKIKVIGLKELFTTCRNEQLIALGPFWSTKLGRIIFSTTANFSALFLMPPLIMLKGKFYLTDIPNVERLGHAIANVDVLIAELDAGFYKTSNKINNILVFYPKISFIEDNGFVYFPKIKFIDKIRKCINSNRVVILHLHPWFEKVIKRALLKTGSAFISPRPAGHRDIFNLIQRSSSLFSLPSSDEKACIKYFEKNNFKLDRPIILCSCRSTGNINYKKYTESFVSEEKRYGYRNSSFMKMIPSIQHLLHQGYNVIKLGSSSTPCSISSKQFFDYSMRPLEEKNFLLDLFLFSRCLFFIGDTSGNYAIAQALRKPICFINFAPLGHFHSWCTNSLSIFKTLQNRKTGKLVSFKDQLKYQYGYEIHNEKVINLNRYVENSEKQILETVKEMVANISGCEYKTDKALQKHFQKLFVPSYLHQSVNSKCGDYFLRTHKNLLIK
jgi:putative glycosyltransferase (TIGR04372 family)